jgi:hypothetical protein
MPLYMKNLLRTAATLGMVVTAACAPSSEVLSPFGSSAELVGDRNNDFSLAPGIVNVCAFFGDAAVPPGGDFSASAPAGEDVIAGSFNITPAPHCIEVWNASNDNTVTVSSSALSATPGWQLDRIFVSTGDSITVATSEWLFGVSTGSVTVNREIGGVMWFKFVPVVLPPEGGQGCTPGYWRRSQHHDSWTSPYAPNTLFSDVFANAFPGKTLLEVAHMTGGGLNALGRHTVAALLNGASAGVSYDLTTAQVITGFNTAFATGRRKKFIEQKDVFEFLNEQGCPLN